MGLGDKELVSGTRTHIPLNCTAELFYDRHTKCLTLHTHSQEGGEANRADGERKNKRDVG